MLDLATDPDWSALEARFGGVLLHRCGDLSEVARRFSGGILHVASAPGGSPGLLVDFQAGLIARGVVASAPELVVRLHGAPDASDWRRWRGGLFQVAAGVLIAPEPESAASRVVWNEACTALFGSKPVYLLGDW